MEESKLKYHEICQKNMRATVEKYIHTDFPVYTTLALYHFKSFWKRLGTKEPPAPIVVAFEETVGIHMIEVDAWVNAYQYIYFIPFEEIKKVIVLFPSFFLTTSIIIKTYSQKKYFFNIMKYYKLMNPDQFGNSGFLAFIKRLKEYSKSLV